MPIRASGTKFWTDQPTSTWKATVVNDVSKPEKPGAPLSSESLHRNLHSTDKMYQYPEQPYATAYGHETPPSALNMGDMRPSLPQYHPQTVYYDQHSLPQHYMPPGHAHGVLYPVPHMSPFHGPAASFTNVYPPYFHQQHPNSQIHHGGTYQPHLTNSQPQRGVSLVNQGNGYTHTYYPQHVYTTTRPQKPGASGHSNPNNPTTKTQTPYKNSTAPPPPHSDIRNQSSNLDYDVSKTIVDGSNPMRNAQVTSASMARGPLRKPKQSGHALWVGNLPPGTGIVELKDYFSRDATKDVESVFLISKSNCAFINYKSETACLAALSRFHDSRFHGARLVCRLRRGVVDSAPTDTPAFSTVPSLRGGDGDEVNSAFDEERAGTPAGSTIGERKHSGSRISNRYFIVKSLAVDDLELSRRSGIWATQSHNEKVLNHAYETADNVYLIFSANKSGEYYGYARMMAPIQEDEDLAQETPPRPEQIPTEPDNLNITSTPATTTAPNGRIINDPARGTTFWEADTSSEDEDPGQTDSQSEKSVGNDAVEEPAESGFQSIGSPFRIQWCSTERVPFQRTRGLRNPWNANREVKIARDGTEIEPSVGEKLIHLFHAPHIG